MASVKNALTQMEHKAKTAIENQNEEEEVEDEEQGKHLKNIALNQQIF
jgi:hypothetical protein